MKTEQRFHQCNADWILAGLATNSSTLSAAWIDDDEDDPHTPAICSSFSGVACVSCPATAFLCHGLYHPQSFSAKWSSEEAKEAGSFIIYSFASSWRWSVLIFSSCRHTRILGSPLQAWALSEECRTSHTWGEPFSSPAFQGNKTVLNWAARTSFLYSTALKFDYLFLPDGCFTHQNNSMMTSLRRKRLKWCLLRRQQQGAKIS